jgi:ketosteroid isomerase-like protein
MHARLALGSASIEKEAAMGELELELRDFFGTLDRMEFEPLFDRVTDDMQGVDEISRSWTRGKSEFATKVGLLTEAISDLRTEITGTVEHIWGDTGVVTCWIEQDYTHEGAPQHVSTPTTAVFRRVDGAWKMALFHSIPVSE